MTVKQESVLHVVSDNMCLKVFLTKKKLMIYFEEAQATLSGQT
jgi:hypothetical protein